MNTSKKIWIGVVAALLIVGGVFFYYSTSSDEVTDTSVQQSQVETSSLTVNSDGTVIMYTGVEGEIALDTLKNLTDVYTESSSFGEFVIGIGDVDADSNKNFWGFYVNDEMATVGAGEYVTKEGDQIEWRLTELE